MAFETILYEEDGPIGWLTLNRPDDGNMFTPLMCHEIRDCIDFDEPDSGKALDAMREACSDVAANASFAT
ncbi:MAG: hypothetical protein ACO3P0_11300 [Quisquiliibacterium sp.]